MNIWYNVNEQLPQSNVLVKVELTNGCEAIDFVNMPLDDDCPFQHYCVSSWRYLQREELNKIFNKFYDREE